MSSDLLGDPSSCASLAASLRRRASGLEQDVGAVAAAHAEATPGWVGRVAVTHRRRLDDVQARTETAVTGMRGLADRLEACADAMSELQVELRQVREAADRLGLVVEAGRVVQDWGISGEADAASRSAVDEDAAVLQRRLARVVQLLERRRADLGETTREVADALG